uniref:hypothetical protein n=1 Tax=Pontibacterium sp. TaxID=2036026 RepID=UPI0035616149
HDDAMRRIGKQVDDHETRLRDLEDDVRNLQGDRRAVAGGWKVLATIGASVATITTIAIGLATYVSQTAGG